MKKLLISLLAIAFLLSGCSGNNANEEAQVQASDFYGVWEYSNFDNWLSVNSDGTYELYLDDGSSDSGEYYIEGANLHLNSDTYFTFDEDGDLMDDQGNLLFKSSLPDDLEVDIEYEEPYVSYFDQYNLDYTYDLGDGIVKVENGMWYCEGSEGDYYGRSYLEFGAETISEEDLGNGFTEILFRVDTAMNWNDMPVFLNTTSGNYYFTLMDEYSGYLLPLNDDFQTGESDGVYYFEFGFESEEGWVDLEIEVGISRNRDPDDDYLSYDTRAITVTMPDWYDGLVLLVVEMPGSYEEFLDFREKLEAVDTYITPNELGFPMNASLMCNLY